MHNFFRNNRGPVFAVDGITAGATPIDSQNALAAGGGGGDSEMKAMFDQGMAQQKAMYAESMQEAQQKNELQTQGDAALKTLKAVSIS